MFIILFFLLAEVAFADLLLPTNLTDPEQQKIVRDLGTSLSPHLMGQAYPLGGYDGFEVGGYHDFLSTGSLSNYGSQPDVQSSTGVNSFVIGKGFFYDLDFYLAFSPLGQSEAIQNFAGAVKWTFYQSDSWPAFTGVQVGLHSTNIQNQIILTGENAILFSGLHFLPIHLYGGFGLYRAQGKFMAALTSSGQESNVSIGQQVFLGGVSYSYKKFLAQMNVLNAVETTLQLGFYYKL